MRRAARAAALACLLALPAAGDVAGGDDALRDPEFGVTARGAVGLERNVAMYQWKRDGNAYAKAWSGNAVDSSGFSPGHENPADIPLRSRRWMPGRVLLDGHPVAPEAIEALATWKPLRPDFSALPGNLSATFQPEGDGLGSAANPVHPEVGDLRITWRERRMPPTREPLVLRDVEWGLRDPAGRATRDARDTAGTPRHGTWAWIVLGMFAGALFAGVLLLLRRRR